MKLSDYVMEFVKERGVDTIFGLTGGAVVHLFDSVTKVPGLKNVFCHHEQAAALAAFSYAKIKNSCSCAIVTTGPGGTNAVTGVLAAYQDSIPVVFLSGQARLEHTTYKSPLRQRAPQELDIVSVVESICKYAVMIEDPKSIRYHLEKAFHLAVSGRPGPVWLDIPVNFQWSDIDESSLVSYKPEEDQTEQSNLSLVLKDCENLLRNAHRPLLMIGYGVRLSRSEKELTEFIEKLQIPFVSSWTAADLLPTNHPLYLGRPGMMGQRGANLAVQNCDFLLVVGSHLCIPQTGTNFKYFAREAKKIMVNIDGLELENTTIEIDLKIKMDAKDFFKTITTKFDKPLELDQNWQEKYPLYKNYNKASESNQPKDKKISSYVFIDQLSECLKGDESIIVDGGGVSLFTSFQGFKLKIGQRLQVSSAMSSMGSGLPEAVGASFANPKNPVICISGDGSMQLNIQELETMRYHKLPIKIFVQNNKGYLSIRHTQDGFLEGKHIGSSVEGGVGQADLISIAKAYGILAIQVESMSELSDKIKWTLSQEGPVLCQIPVPFDQKLIPTAGFDRNEDGTFAARPFEDMAPYLSRNEFKKAMMIDPVKASL